MAVVLDASAILALLKDEPGADKVVDVLINTSRRPSGQAALVSAVNLTEIYEQLGADAILPPDLFGEAGSIEIVPFGGDQMIATAVLRASTRHLGLSLADRACLALGQLTSLPVLTADAAWSSADLDLTVVQIR